MLWRSVLLVALCVAALGLTLAYAGPQEGKPDAPQPKPDTPKPQPDGKAPDTQPADGADKGKGAAGPKAGPPPLRAQPVNVEPLPKEWAGTGLYRHRWDRSRVAKKEGSSGTNRAITDALDWLVRHQDQESGHWSCVEYSKACRKPDRICKNKGSHSNSTGPGFAGFDVGVTGLAVLAFTGRGNTHRFAEKAEYQATLERASRYLISSQELGMSHERGFIGKSSVEEAIYNHAIATQALAELLLGSRDCGLLAETVARAVDFTLRSQNQGYGWRYGYKPARNDTSVTLWMVMAVLAGEECAKAGLIDIAPERFERARKDALRWFTETTARAGKVGYMSPGDPGSTLLRAYPEPFPFRKSSSCTAGVVWYRQLIGDKEEGATDAGLELTMADKPTWDPHAEKCGINFYYWFYATQAVFQRGGKEWKAWNKQIKRVLIKNRRTKGCEKGSWDPIGEWSIVGGRVYATAINALTLESYYRFARHE